jgi:CheY-like chemotaxis protein
MILVVDDDADARAILADAFHQLGAIAVMTSTATLALEIVATVRPQAVVTDLHLPHGARGGGWLLREIRQLGAQRILVFALSDEMTEHDRATMEAVGFDGFFPKPFDPLAVASAILGRVKTP